MSEILDEALNLICIYLNWCNNDIIIDYKQFSRELRKFYRKANYLSFTAGVLDELLENIECALPQRRSAWVANFVTKLGKLYN